jgi:hypothetical protein
VPCPKQTRNQVTIFNGMFRLWASWFLLRLSPMMEAGREAELASRAFSFNLCPVHAVDLSSEQAATSIQPFVSGTSASGTEGDCKAQGAELDNKHSLESEGTAPGLRQRKGPAALPSQNGTGSSDQDAGLCVKSRGSESEGRGVAAALCSDQDAGPLAEASAHTPSFAAAVPVAAFQTAAARMALAVAAAFLAVHGHLATVSVSPVLQLLATNAAITISAAWLLTKQPERYRALTYQMQLRASGMLKTAVSFAERALGRQVVAFARVLAGLAWGAYVDSGCYLALVLSYYLLRRGYAPLGDADVLQAAQQASADDRGTPGQAFG